MTIKELACNYSLGQKVEREGSAKSSRVQILKPYRLYQINILKKTHSERRKFTPGKLKHMTNQEITQFIEKSPCSETVKLK